MNYMAKLIWLCFKKDLQTYNTFQMTILIIVIPKFSEVISELSKLISRGLLHYMSPVTQKKIFHICK